MKYNLLGLGSFDPFCLTACVAQLDTAPTEEEQMRLKEIAAKFFSELANDGHRPQLLLRFDQTTVHFTQLSSSRKVERHNFSMLLEKLGFQKPEGAPPQAVSKPSSEEKIAPAEKKGRMRSRTSPATHAAA